jgi:hypothetical protein
MTDYSEFDYSDANQLVSAGCWQCGTFCPWTDETDPPLTKELSDLWFDAHKKVCSMPDADPIIGVLKSWDEE